MTRKWSMLNYICEIMPTCQTSILQGSLRCGHQRGSCPQSVNSELFFLYVAFSLLVFVGLYPISRAAITLNYSIENISPSATYILTHNNVHNTPANYLLYGFGLWNRSRHCVVLVSLKHCCDYHCSWALTLLVLYRHLSKVQWTIGNVFCFVWW